MVKNSERPGHRQCQMQQTSNFSWPLERKARAERCHIAQTRDLGPFVTYCFATVYFHWQRQLHSLANPRTPVVRFYGFLRQKIYRQNGLVKI